ncbi:hypothetical protein ACFQZ4_49125 [Catellatospora coxensis]
MAFAVNLEAMYAVPDMLDRLGADARRCYAYAGEWFDFEYGPGVIDKARGKHAQARAEVTGYFLAIAKRAEALARSVRISLAGYAEVDHSEAARLDSTLPAQTYHPAWRTPAITTDRLQVQALEQYEPAAHLTQVKDYLPEWPYEPEWSDLVSPGNIVRDLMMAANWLGVQVGISDRVIDPLDYVSNNLCGNWAACAPAATPWRTCAAPPSTCRTTPSGSKSASTPPGRATPPTSPGWRSGSSATRSARPTARWPPHETPTCRSARRSAPSNRPSS